MAVAANRRSVMTLFTGPDDIHSHRVRIVLAEKGINFETVEVDEENKPEDLADLNPYNEVPTLADRDLALYDSHVIMEYLDERFPHPPLMPVDPVSRARTRLMMHRIERDLYSEAEAIMTSGEKNAAKARKALRDKLAGMAPLFEHVPYFLSDEYTLADSCLLALLWRLPMLKVNLPKQAAALQNYGERGFARSGFKAALTEAEKEMRA